MITLQFVKRISVHTFINALLQGLRLSTEHVENVLQEKWGTVMRAKLTDETRLILFYPHSEMLP